jgi:hypothetical protein
LNTLELNLQDLELKNNIEEKKEQLKDYLGVREKMGNIHG